MCLARPYTARHQATKDCSVLHDRKLMSLGVVCVHGGVDGLRLVSQREREARWKLGGSTYSVCASCVCGYGLGYTIP